MKLDGQIAVVFGAAQGIGKAYITALLEHGVKVYFGDILLEEGKATEQELQAKYGKERVTFGQCDVTKEDNIKELFTQAQSLHGEVNIAVAHAGLIDEREWQRMVDVNVGGTVRAFNAARTFMGKNSGGKGGTFVATSSISGLTAIPNLPTYTATKHALVGLMRAWGSPENFQLHGIRTNVLCPGMVSGTHLFDKLGEDMMACKEHLEMALAWVGNAPPEQMLSPDQVAAGLIRVLEEEDVTGQCLRITSSAGQEYVEWETQPL